MNALPALRTRAYGDQRLTTVGLGACRERGEDGPDIVVDAIGAGCNAFITAPHFHHGAHQRAVGEGINAALAASLCDRASVFVATHVGRVPELVAKNVDALGYASTKSFIESEFIARGLFAWDELAHGDHTLATPYLRHAVQESVRDMSLSHVDCVFLDSPEQQLRVVPKTGYVKRLYAALETLEGLCSTGLVGSYGIATSNPAFDVAELLALAHDVAGPFHKLRAIQVPLSLLRQDALTSGLTKRAADLGLHVFATGCLDGGTPGYQIPEQLDAELGLLADAAIGIRWVQSAPGVGTAVFGTRDARHLRANLAAAQLPALGPAFYATSSPE
jgi:aryl-alcohol dehydrogenase-like predicted oxidoreductase